MVISEPVSIDLEGDFRTATLREDANHFKGIAGILNVFGIFFAVIDFRLFGLSKPLLYLYLVREQMKGTAEATIDSGTMFTIHFTRPLEGGTVR